MIWNNRWGNGVDEGPSRRTFLQNSAVTGVVSLLPSLATAADVPTRQATGIRVGEVTDRSAIIWMRLTTATTRLNTGVVAPARKAKKKAEVPDDIDLSGVAPESFEGACPGSSGRVRVRYSPREDLAGGLTTDWVQVSEAEDFVHQFALADLAPGTTYHYAGESGDHGTLRGRFRTAPSPDEVAPVHFCVMTCQGYPDRGHPDGHGIYPSMQALSPDFTCLTGDLVYYDNDLPAATSTALARLHWERMFSLTRLVDFTRSCGTYWLKDDHDTLKNDAWPGQKAGQLTFAEGQRIFRQQAPLHNGPGYRTFRWGRDLQIWLTEGRDFRSDNDQTDGPGKTIWGAEQKAWLQESLLASDATWKVLVSPTPLVGPDRPQGKNDNHSNRGFQTEGDEIRAWLHEHTAENLFVICGDRHWQYHSVHPESGLHEWSVGAASDEHAGGSPGEDPAYHRFHRVAGGFLSVAVGREASKAWIECRHHAVDGTIVYQWRALDRIS